MKRIVLGLTSLLITTLPCERALAWSHANRFGGRTSHAYGATTHTNAWGGGSAHAYGVGTVHANAYGGGAAHAYGGGAVHTNPYGKTTAYSGYDHYYGGSTAVYHPPVAVHSYAAGCYNCGGWAAAAGAAAGAAVGVAVGTAAASAQTSAATSNAYSAGYAAGATATVYTLGAIYATLPAGCASPIVHGMTYYLCGNTWFSPSYGANGVSYRVVPVP